MRSAQSVRRDIIEALSEVADSPLGQVGFVRASSTLLYQRNMGVAVQSIEFVADLFPRYEARAEAHLHPTMRLSISAVSQRALELVNGDKMLLANAPDVIVSQPIDFAAPKDMHERWFASGLVGFKARVGQINDFVNRWVIPLFDELATIESLVRAYEREDWRLLRQRHWYIFVAAAFDLLGRREEAREVLSEKFRSPSARRRYESAFSELS